MNEPVVVELGPVEGRGLREPLAGVTMREKAANSSS